MRRRNDGSCKLGRARAERNDGKPDNERRNTKFRRNTRRAVNEPIRALYEHYEPDHQKQNC